MPDLKGNIPTVLKVTPSLSDVTTSSIPDIQIYFSISMDESSLNTDDKVNRGLLLVPVGEQTPISLTFVEYNSRLKRLTVNPSEALVPGTTYNLAINSLSNGFVSINNRQLSTNKDFLFSISQWELPKPQLLFPSDGDVITSSPTLQISLGPFESPTGEVVSIYIEMSETSYFNESLFWSGTIVATGSTTHTITPGTLDLSKTYYWRARLKGTTEYSGPWSDVYNFTFDDRTNINLDSRRYDEDTSAFNAVISDLAEHDSNLVDWPDITLVFSKDIENTLVSGDYQFDESYFSIKSESVDGSIPRAVEGTWAMTSPTTVTFTPTAEKPSANTRYTIRVIEGMPLDNGETLQEDIKYIFTSRYSPLYAYPVQLRAQFGSMAQMYPDDLLYFHLYRASLEANFKLRLGPWISIDPLLFFSGPGLTDLRSTEYSDVYTVHMWTIYTAMISVMSLKLYEKIPESDGSLKIGDYEENLISAQALNILSKKIKDLEKDRLVYEELFSKKTAIPKAPIKSSRYPSDRLPLFDRGYKRRSDF